MNTISRDIFRAIHEGKWLSIEYRNRQEETTKYWIGIRDLDIRNRTLSVDGLHLRRYTVAELDRIRIDAILSSGVVEGSYCPVNQRLVRDIYENPQKYASLFDNAANLKILNYLEMCNRMDTTPYLSDFALARYLDRERIRGEYCPLSEEHFDDAAVRARDRRKEKICSAHNLQLIRVENSYARRYNHIKEILIDYFSRRH